MISIALIGAGRLATQLAIAIARHSRHVAVVTQVWSRHKSSATVLAERLNSAYTEAKGSSDISNGQPLSAEPTAPVSAAWGSLDAVTLEADAYIIAVPDDAIATLAANLHQRCPQALIAHTSGTTALAAITSSGHTRAAVLYPLQTFSLEGETDFSRVHIFIETATATDHQLLTTLASTLTPEANIHSSTSASRRQLHLAAVFASNFVCHCCTLAEALLTDAQLPFSVLQPLVEEQVSKLRTMPPAAAQTGPALRHDSTVIGTHLAMLASTPRIQELYRLLTHSIQATAAEASQRQ